MKQQTLIDSRVMKEDWLVRDVWFEMEVWLMATFHRDCFMYCDDGSFVMALEFMFLQISYLS